MTKVKEIIENRDSMSREELKNSLVSEYKSFLSSFNKEDILIEISCDNKGYMWIKRDINDQFKERLSKDGWEDYTLETTEGYPLNAVISGVTYDDSFLQYPYLSVYDFEISESLMLEEAIYTALIEVGTVLRSE